MFIGVLAYYMPHITQFKYLRLINLPFCFFTLVGEIQLTCID